MAEGGHRALARQLQYDLARAQARCAELEGALAKAQAVIEQEWGTVPATPPTPAPRARKVTHKVRAK